MKFRNCFATLVPLLLLTCLPISTAGAAIIIPQGGFDAADWIVNPYIDPTRNPIREGTVKLHAQGSGFIGTVIYRNLNVLDIAGKAVHIKLRLSGNYSWDSSVALYFTYIDNTGSQRVRAMNPLNSTIPSDPASEDALKEGVFLFPEGSQKLIKIELVKENYGEFFAHEFSLTTDEANPVNVGDVPIVDRLSSYGGLYGSSLTIFGGNFGTSQGIVTIGGSPQGVFVRNWSDNLIELTIQDPAISGPVKVIRDHVESRIDHRFKVLSEYFTIKPMQPFLDLIKGQTAYYAFEVSFFNGFNPAGGVAFQVSGLPDNLVAQFLPAPVQHEGGTMLKIETGSLTPGSYPMTVQAAAAGLQPRSAQIQLEIDTISDIQLNLDQNPILSQGYQFIEASAFDSSQNERWGMPGEIIQLSSDRPDVFFVHPGFMDYQSYALSTGSAKLTARAPDGYTEEFTVTVDLAGQPQVAINLQPNSISNKPSDVIRKWSEPIYYHADVTTGDGSISNYSDPWEFELSEDTRVMSGSSFSGYFKVDLSRPPKTGTYLFEARKNNYEAECIAPFTIFNDTSYSGALGEVLVVKSDIMVEYFTLEFHDPITGELKFSKEVETHHGGPFQVDAIEPGIYKIRATGEYEYNSYSQFIPQWYPNAADEASALPVTFEAGQYVQGLFFFVRPSPAIITGNISFDGAPTGSVRVALFDNPDFLNNDSEPVYEINLGVPSSFPVGYEFTPVLPGAYYAAAFMDANGNGEFDRYIDPLGSYFYSYDPTRLRGIYVSAGSFTSNVDIPLQNAEAEPAGSASVSGRILYSGNETGKIWVTLYENPEFSGAPAYQSAADSSGNYSIRGITAGAYYLSAHMEIGQSSGPSGSYEGSLELMDSDYRSGIDFTIFDREAVSISGTVYYSGGASSVRIGIFMNSDFSGEPVAGTQISGPGPFFISGISPGTAFFIGAFMDLNSNGQRDPEEPSGAFYGNPFSLSAYEAKEGVNIFLQEKEPGLAGNLGGLVFGLPEGDEDVPISSAQVRVLGTTLSTETRPIGDFAFDLPPDSSFIVKASKSGYLDSYSTSGRISGEKNEIEILMLTPDQMSTWTGVETVSGKGHLVMMVHDISSLSAENDLVFGATAVIRNLAGQEPADIAIRYFTEHGASMHLSPDSTPDSGTTGFIVCNLQPGLYQVSAQATGGVFAWRPAIVYPDSITIGFGSKSGILKVNGVIDIPIFVEDEVENPIPEAGVQLLGSNLSTTTDSEGQGSFTGVPVRSTGPIKTSKQGYIDTYTFETFGGADDEYDFSLISRGMMSALAEQAGISLDQAKGHIVGEVDFFGEIPGAAIAVLNADGTVNANARVFYMSAEGNGIDPSLTSTSSDCTFFIFNLDPTRPVFLHANKGDAIFPLVMTKVWADSLTVADIELGGDLEVIAFSQNWSDAGYHAGLGVHDPDNLLTSVTVSGYGIVGTVSLNYPTMGQSWWIQENPSLSATLPLEPYIFTLTTKSGQVYQVKRRITGYVNEFATGLMPSGLTLPAVTFRWTGISDPSASYSIELYDETQGYNRIWERYGITGSLEVPYDGPTLIPGKSYRYNIVAMVRTDGVSNSSFATGSFTVTNRIKMPGDTDGNQKIDLKDAVLSLQIATGKPLTVNLEADVNGDGRVGISEAAYILAVLSGLRAPATILQPPLVEGTASLISRNWDDNDGFKFRPPTVTGQSGNIDFYVETNIIFLADGVGAQYLGLGALENFQELPETNYIYSPNEWDLGILEAGQVFSFKLADGTYALVEFTEVAAPEGPEGSDFFRCSFRYRYNPDGSRFFTGSL